MANEAAVLEEGRLKLYQNGHLLKVDRLSAERNTSTIIPHNAFVLGLTPIRITNNFIMSTRIKLDDGKTDLIVPPKTTRELQN